MLNFSYDKIPFVYNFFYVLTVLDQRKCSCLEDCSCGEESGIKGLTSSQAAEIVNLLTDIL